MFSEELKQYLKYFRVWLVILVILGVCVGVKIAKTPKDLVIERTNFEASAERVYDYADVLTDEEEESLRSYIAVKEMEIQADFVIVTTAIPVEGPEAIELTGLNSRDWSTNMMNLADDFWDENKYGYNVSFNGDGSLLLDNRYPKQMGEWLSTSGKVYHKLSDDEIDSILDEVDRYYNNDPYQAYVAYIDAVVAQVTPHKFGTGDKVFACIVAFFVAIGFYANKISQKQAPDTVTTRQYVAGDPVVHLSTDNFMRKYTTSRKIETSSGGGGGGHHSSSGASHGGGGHRH